MLATAVLPALALITEGIGGHDVFPLGTLGAVLLLAGLVSAGGGVDAPTRLAHPGPFAAAIQVAHGAACLVQVDLLFSDDLGFGEGRRRVGEGGEVDGEEQGYGVEQFFHGGKQISETGAHCNQKKPKHLILLGCMRSSRPATPP
ncbi:hypothetical protein D3C79_848060 [compost metagenome]